MRSCREQVGMTQHAMTLFNKRLFLNGVRKRYGGGGVLLKCKLQQNHIFHGKLPVITACLHECPFIIKGHRNAGTRGLDY